MREFLRKWMNLDLGALLLGGKVSSTRSFPMRNYLEGFAWICRESLSVIRPTRIFGRYLLANSPLHHIKNIVGCGAPLASSLQVVAEDAPYPVRMALGRLGMAVERGKSLADAMKEQPRVFPRHCVDLVRAGEEGGDLIRALEAAIDIQNRRMAIFHAFITPVQYFLVVILGVLAVSTFLAIKVFPTLLDDFAEAGGFDPSQVPWFYTPLLGLAHLARTGPKYITNPELFVGMDLFRALCAGLSVAFVAVFLLAFVCHRSLGHVLLYVPGIRRVLAMANLSHVARILALLLRAGYPLDEALDSVAHSSVHRPFARMLIRVRDRVRAGQDFVAAGNTESKFLMPVLFRGMSSAALTAGLFPETLEQLADYYETRLFSLGMIVSRTLLPCFVLVGGGMVFMVYTYPYIIYTKLVDSLACSF